MTPPAAPAPSARSEASACMPIASTIARAALRPPPPLPQRPQRSASASQRFVLSEKAPSRGTSALRPGLRRLRRATGASLSVATIQAAAWRQDPTQWPPAPARGGASAPSTASRPRSPSESPRCPASRSSAGQSSESSAPPPATMPPPPPPPRESGAKAGTSASTASPRARRGRRPRGARGGLEGGGGGGRRGEEALAEGSARGA